MSHRSLGPWDGWRTCASRSDVTDALKLGSEPFRDSGLVLGACQAQG